MTEHSKEPWRYDRDLDEVSNPHGLLGDIVGIWGPINVEHACACVNALADLKPERLNGLVGAVKMIVDDNITMQGRCEQCDEVNSHESWCYVGILQTALAEVKA